jgi:WD40 repeat protein
LIGNEARACLSRPSTFSPKESKSIRFRYWIIGGALLSALVVLNIVWLCNTPSRDVQLIGHKKGVNDIVFSPDGKLVATASDDNTVRLWSLSGKAVRTIQGHSDRVIALAFSPVSEEIAWGASGCADSPVSYFGTAC